MNPEKTPILLKRRPWVDSPVLRVLGVDPGLASTGFAVVTQERGHQAVVTHLSLARTEKESKKGRTNLRVSVDDKRRYNEVWSRMFGLYEEYQVHAIGVEVYSPFQGKFGAGQMGMGFSSAWKTAVVYGMVMGFSFAHSLLIFPFLPMDLKRGILGKKSGSKEEVEVGLGDKTAGLRMLLEDFPRTQREHLTDAVGYAYLGLCELYNLRKMMGVEV